jgi:hypothetical protein
VGESVPGTYTITVRGNAAMIPKPQRDDKGKVQGEFYPLQKAELVALRKAKLINNAAFVHLALRYENPFCDRPIVVIPKEFALRWQIPESSVYEAIAKLKENHAINIRSGRVTLEWASDDSQQASDSENPEKLRNPRKNSEIPEKITESQKKLRNPRKNSGSSENRDSKPAQCKDSRNLQTIQTYSDFFQTLSEGEREKFLEFGLKKAAELPKPPTLPQKWVEQNYNELYEQFKKTPEGKKIARLQDWENHPRRDEWLEEMLSKGAGAFVGLAPEQERSERLNFREWVQANNCIRGNNS